jgi:hypothetical protein
MKSFDLEFVIPEAALNVPVFSAGMMAQKEGVPIHAVQYLLRSRQIKATRKVGNIGLFTGQQFLDIRSALADIKQRRKPGVR